MKLAKTLLAGLILAPTMVYSAVTVNVPKGVQILTINGEDAGYSSFGFDYKEQIELDNGVGQIVFRIAKIVYESGSDKTKFKSQPLVATFELSDSNVDITVPKITTFQQGMEFNNSPSFEIVRNNEPISSIKKDQLSLGFNLASDMVKEVDTYNRSNEIASLSHYKNIAPQTTEVILNDDSYKTLKSAYTQATKEERKKFLTWAISNLEN